MLPNINDITGYKRMAKFFKIDDRKSTGTRNHAVGGILATCSPPPSFFEQLADFLLAKNTYYRYNGSGC